ncbi:MAG: helix-turn-helix transcriptional regulator [Sulfitobacter sp.]|nr:helix-turn-helix transcriptional regulator [Sulfitobacter sp.]
MPAAEIASLGSLIADRTRVEILCVLMDGRAHTGGELARYVGVSTSTASEHLARLLDAAVVRVEAQGRHRYFQLADRHTAELLELLGAVSTPLTPTTGRTARRLSHARSCYDHLAGVVAVNIYDGLIGNRYLILDEDQTALTDTGRNLFTELGIDVESVVASKRPTVRRCLDWTERRHHLAGALGAALFDTMLTNEWIRPGQEPRSIQISTEGTKALHRHFGLAVLPPIR